MVALPFPVGVEVTTIQLSLLNANQGQVLPVLSETLPSAEKAPKACEVGVIE
jgi:hypothetical protein